MEYHASTEGVAEPITKGIPRVLHLCIATCLAWYLGAFPALYEPSCSSSIIIIPRFGTGAKIALLAPITIRASFRIMRLHSESLWLGVSPEWSTAAVLPNLLTAASTT